MGQWLTSLCCQGGTERSEHVDAGGAHVVWRIGGPRKWDARRVRDPPLIHTVDIPRLFGGEALVLYGEEGTGKRIRARDAARQHGMPLFEIEMEEWREMAVLERLALISRMRELIPRGGCLAIHIRILDSTAYDAVLTTLMREFRGSAWRVILTLNSGDLGMVRTLLELRGVRASWVAQWMPVYPLNHRKAMVQLSLIRMGNLKLGDGSKSQHIPWELQRCPFALELLQHARRRSPDEDVDVISRLRWIVQRAARTVAWNPLTIFCTTVSPSKTS